MEERVNVYLDGFNFYYGLMAKGWGRYRWLDYRALVARRIRPGQVLREIKYFTAPVTHEADKLPRQNSYVRALEQHAKVRVIRGAFEMRDKQCPNCENWYKRPQEKRTDVNIATHLLADAFDDTFDTAYLVCADADLVPAVSLVKQRFGKTFVLIDPPRRHSDELAILADHHWHFLRSHLNQCQLPNPVEYQSRRGKTKRIYRPDSWGPPDSN